MSFPKLSFPLQVDFGQSIYWIGNQGPFQYGEAVTAFFDSEEIADKKDVGDSLLLMRCLERYLQTFGRHLQPYTYEGFYDSENIKEVLFQPDDDAAQCSVYFTFHYVEENKAAFVERYTFRCLWDFLYVELCKAIQVGNAPRQCRWCGRWFLHIQGEKFLYCEHIAPTETDKTCREIGARATFEHKIRSDEVWKIYKRAYKKYYARVMKGNMTRDEFNSWVVYAASQREITIEMMRVTKDEDRAQLIEEMQKNLNAK